jgi:VWFA-related protein
MNTLTRHAPWTFVAVAALVTASSVAPELRAQQRAARDRHVMVSVTGKDDQPVKDLRDDEFTVREDGAVREILSVTRGTTPLQVALLADNSQAAEPLAMEMRVALGAFVQRLLSDSPDSEVSLVTVGERPIKQVDYTTSPTVLARGIAQILPKSGAGSFLIQAMIDAARALKKREARRPVIVAFTIEDGPEFSTTDRTLATKVLKETGVSLWTIVLQSRSLAPASGDELERTFIVTQVAKESGGDTRMVGSPQQLQPAFQAVAALLTSQYDVTYARPDRLIPPTRLDVEVKRPGLKVAASHWAGQ